jgi:hypothetical protein
MIEENKVAIYSKMVNTRQGTRTEPPSTERTSRDQNAQDLLDKDPLYDMVSFAPMRSFETLRERITKVGEDRILNLMEEIPIS